MSRPNPKPCKRQCGTLVLIAKKARPPRAGRSPFIVLDAKELNPNAQHDGRVTRILDGFFAYTIAHAHEHVDQQAAVLTRPGDATDIHDLPWHRIHDCPNADRSATR